MTDDLHPTVPADDPACGTTTATANSSEELAAAKAKAEENYNKFLCAMADFENYKKRVERQFADISLADFGRKEITLAEHEMPGLMGLRAEFGPLGLELERTGHQITSTRRAPSSPCGRAPIVTIRIAPIMICAVMPGSSARRASQQQTAM